MPKKVSLGQNKRHKKCTLFSFQTNHSFIFNSRFRLAFIKFYIFVQQKTWNL